jgi:hypothetical protein
MSCYRRAIVHDRGRGGWGVIDMLETGLLEMGWNDGVRLLSLDFFGCRSHLIFVIVVVALTGEIIGSFVLMRWAELEGNKMVSQHIPLCHVRSEMTYILIATESLVHVTRGVLIEFLVMTKDDNGDIDGTKNGQLMSLLKQSTFSLEEGPAIEKSALQSENLSEFSNELTLNGCDHP